MNAEQAIAEITSQESVGVKAFQVISMTEEDIEAYYPQDLKEKFLSMPPEKRAEYLSRLIDDIYDVIEEGYGFRKLMLDALQCRIEDGTETLAE